MCMPRLTPTNRGRVIGRHRAVHASAAVAPQAGRDASLSEPDRPMEGRISDWRSRASSARSRLRISASMRFNRRSICFSRCLLSCLATGVRKCLPRLVNP